MRHRHARSFHAPPGSLLHSSVGQALRGTKNADKRAPNKERQKQLVWLCVWCEFAHRDREAARSRLVCSIHPCQGGAAAVGAGAFAPPPRHLPPRQLLRAAGGVGLRARAHLVDDDLVGLGDRCGRGALARHAGTRRVGPQGVEELLDGGEVRLGVELDDVVVARPLDDVRLATVGLGAAPVELDRVRAVDLVRVRVKVRVRVRVRLKVRVRVRVRVRVGFGFGLELGFEP